MSYSGTFLKAQITVSDKAPFGSAKAIAVSIFKSIFGVGTAMFNPADFSLSRDMQYAEHKIPGLDRPIQQFISGGAQTMQFSLLFDTYTANPGAHNIIAMASGMLPDIAKVPVTVLSKPITKLMDVMEDLHAPPEVAFSWGPVEFIGYMVSCSEKFTMFNSIGTPVRSVVEITLRSSEVDKAVRSSPDRTKHRTVTEGDRLYNFAYSEYGDPSQWRVVADANGISNPRRLRSGTNIVVPAL